MRLSRTAAAAALAMIIVALILMVTLPYCQASTTDGVVEMYVFNNPECGDCWALNSQILPELKKEYGDKILIKYYDMSSGYVTLQTYRFMVNLEDSYGRSELLFPQIYIGSHALIGPVQMKELPALVAQYARKGGVSLPVLEMGGQVVEPPPPTTTSPPTQQPPSQNVSPLNGPVYVAYFYKNACRECDPVSIELDYLKSFGGTVEVRKYDLGSRRGIEMNAAMCLAYGVPKEKRGISPALFVGSHYLYGKDLNRKALNQAIDAERRTAPPNVPWQAAEQFMDQAKRELKSTFSGFNVFTIMGAGLVDGLNPCAFTVIVFLVAYLAFIGKTGKDTLYVGIAMALTAFLTYLLLGLGLLGFISAVSRSGTAGNWITAIVASITGVFGLVAVYDFIRSKATGKASMTLGMSQSMTQRVHKAIRDHTRTSYLVAGAVVLGILVTVFEFGCTGQVYLPVITFVARSGSDTAKAVFYLVLFCVMSTIPLVVVFLLAYFGTSSKKLTDFGRKHAPVLTLLGGVVMLALSVLLFVTL